jgi:Na+/H+ antiporter NhaD/arsenite permease-like protein
LISAGKAAMRCRLLNQLGSLTRWLSRNRERAIWGGLALGILIVIVVLPSLVPDTPESPAEIQRESGDQIVTLLGQVTDTEGNPLAEAAVRLCQDEGVLDEPIAVETQADGWFRMPVPVSPREVQQLVDDGGQLCLVLERPNFRPLRLRFAPQEWVALGEQFNILLPTTVLEHRIGGAFWFVTAVFVFTMFFIATERLQKTVASLAGAALILIVSQVVGLFFPSWRILDFEGAIHAIDFEVIFLLVGMMLYVGVVEGTGLFQWLAFNAYRAAGGSPWRLTIILVVITALASALLDNVTTVLLMAPITIEIALKIGIDPLAILFPEVLASNFGGTATLVGSPPTILIGTQAGLSFGEFLVTTGPVVVVALAILLLFMRWRYQADYESAQELASAALMKRLEEDARISDQVTLRRGIVVGSGMIALFLVGPQLEVVPALIALTGAAALLIWVRPDVERMVRHVDWTTLLFFMALFIQVGALEEAGLIAKVAQFIGKLAGTNVVTAILLTLWPAMIMSAIIDNVPFAAAMIPVAGYLTRTVPGAEEGIIYWALVFGATFGGNATLIGASANLVTAGIAERAGFRMTYQRFLRVGAPVAIVATVIAMVWLLIIR